MKKKWLQSCIALGATAFIVGITGQAMAVTITESMDHVMSDGSPDPIQHPDAPNMWDVVRFDVTNNSSAFGVYSFMIGANPGGYDFGGGDAMPFRAGESWLPYGYDGTSYLPQKDWNGAGINIYDWSTSLLEVKEDGFGNHYLYNPYSGEDLPFSLPESFETYAYVYWFETNGPFIACTGEYCQDSAPIPWGGTFSFYVTGGLGSPFLYLTVDDYNPSYDPNTPGSLPWTGTFTGSGMTDHGGGTNPVPEPATMLLLGSGIAGLIGTRLRRKNQ